MNVLVLNCGSSSLKFKLIDAAARRALCHGLVDRLGQDRSHAEAIGEALAATRGHTIEAVGHRVVHGGERFRDPARITPEVLAAIEGCVPLAPLHNPHNLAGIRAAQQALPEAPQVAVFDTSFHSTLPGRRARARSTPRPASATGSVATASTARATTSWLARRRGTWSVPWPTSGW